MSNWMPDAKRHELLRLLSDGVSIRRAAKLVGCSNVTAWQYRKLIGGAAELYGEEPIKACACGAEAGHNGWCSARYAVSEKRQRFIRNWTSARSAGVELDSEAPSTQGTSP
jgi:hypothetical protein